MNIEKLVDKAWVDKPLKEIVDAPVDALYQLSERQAALLIDAFCPKIEGKEGKFTVGDLAKLRFVKMAQTLVEMAALED